MMCITGEEFTITIVALVIGFTIGWMLMGILK